MINFDDQLCLTSNVASCFRQFVSNMIPQKKNVWLIQIVSVINAINGQMIILSWDLSKQLFNVPHNRTILFRCHIVTFVCSTQTNVNQTLSHCWWDVKSLTDPCFGQSVVFQACNRTVALYGVWENKNGNCKVLIRTWNLVLCQKAKCWTIQQVV